MDNSIPPLLEQVVLESLGNYLYFNKLKDKVGLVTQWGAPSWLLLQRLHRKGPQSAAELAGARHVSENYIQRLLKELQQAGMIESQGEQYSLTTSGTHALDKIQQVFEKGLHAYADKFDAAELATTLKVLAELREVVAEDQSI
jgi:DNA-binding MarR family transcriptional regulator